MRKGEHLGRLATYKHVPIINIEPSKVESKLSRQWREEGSFALYTEALRAATKEVKNTIAMKDNTFITTLEASIEFGSDVTQTSKSKKYQRRRVLNQREEMLKDTQSKAEGVMSRVLENLGMLEEAPEITKLREKASLKS